jgi:hypothetical protein
MTSRASKLTLAAVLLAGAVPALAAARDCDHASAPPPPVVSAPVYTPPAVPEPPPAYAPAWVEYPSPPAYGDGWRDRRWHEGGWRERGWREGAWRERELASIRADLAQLDAERAEFHAHNAWRPWVLRRYDRHYFERRAQLEHREHELMRFAWR